MSKGKGFGGKTPAKAETSTTALTAGPKLSTPETAMADIGEHYFHAATEQAPAAQFENTHTAIVDYMYTKGYKDAAKTLEAGEEVVITIPKLPVKEDVVLVESTVPKKPTTMVFDVSAMDDDDDDDFASNAKDVKSETVEDTAALEEEREQIYKTLLEVHKKEIDLYVKAKSKYKEGKDYAIRCVWAQCSTGMKAVLKNRKGFSQSRKSGDIIAVIDHVRTACYDFNVAGNPYNVYWHALYRLMNIRQRKNEDGHSFRERLLTAIKRFEQVGGSMSRLIEVDKTDPKMDDVKHTRKVMQSLAAMMMFQQCDNERYGKLKTEYYNNRLAGSDMYPSNWNQAATLLDNYKSEVKTEAYTAPAQGTAKSFLTKAAGTDGGGNTFTIPSGHATGTDGSYHPRIQCNGCEKYGHYVRNCPTHPDPAPPGGGKAKDDQTKGNDEATGDDKSVRFKSVSHFILGNNKEVVEYEECLGDDDDSDYGGARRLEGFSYAQVAKGFKHKSVKMYTEAELKEMGVNCKVKGRRGKMRILVVLDSGSTDHIIKDKELLTNIRYTPNDVLDVETNGGNYVVNQKGTLPGVGTVWYSPKSVINVLSLKHMNAHTDYKVDYYGEDEKPHFVVRNLRSDVVTKFGEVGDIYIHTIEVGEDKKSSVTDSKTGKSYLSSSISTVEANKKLYSKRQVKNADKVKPLLAMLSYPSKKDLIVMIRNRVIGNCPITENDVRRYFEIYGNSEGLIKGKATRKKPEHVTTESLVTIPEAIIKEYRTLTLYADLFFISGMPYFTTISEGIMFTTVEALQNRKYDTIIDALLAVITFYKVKGFIVKFVFSDNELKPMKEAIHDEGNADLNLSAPNEHVPEVERNIKTIKERVRCSINDMPYDKLPKNFKRELVTTCTSMLNAHPRSAGVSQIYSPREIVTGKRLDFKKHCLIAPGDYCLVHEERLTTNTMKPRASRAVAIGVSSNMQGAYQFLMLDTGSIVTRRSWDKLTVTDDVKARMHELAGDEDKHMEIEYHANYYNTADNDADDEAVQDDDAQQVGPEVDATEVTNGGAAVAQDDAAIEQDEAPPNQEDVELLNRLDPLGNDFGNADNFVPDEQGRRVRRSRRVAGVEPAPVMPEEQSHPDEANDTATSNFTDGRMKAKKPVDPYERDHAVGKVYFQMIKERQEKKHEQMSLKRGLKAFGEEGKKAVVKEMQSFKDFEVLEAILASELTRQQREDALPLMMSLKKKRSGDIKGRGLAGGHKDRGKIPPEEATTPTVITESLYISSAIDAYERRFVALLDIPSAYLHAKTGNRVNSIVVLDGILVDLYLQVDPSAASKVQHLKNGKKRLYTKMNKALYGHIMSGRLFWEHISKSLTDMGFIPNPEDLCVFNKDVEGEQCTIVLHVDDIKLSHKDESVVRDVASALEEIYGKMELRTGKVLEYCGITLDYSEDGSVAIGAESYITEAIDEFPEVIDTRFRTPAARHLFEINEECERLEEETRKVFHSIFAKLLWVGKKARPDILVALSFLGKRTESADLDDWKKLKRLLSYLKRTAHLRLRLTVESLNVVKWWADASFAVHEDMKSHSGGFGSLGKGAFYATSRTQKLNTTSSTESEIVAAAEILPQALWTTSFLRNQGYEVKNAILNQDNMAAMQMEMNGVLSRGRKSRHVDVRFFFIKDRVEKGEVDIGFCGTDDMVADYLTKPLQGNKFFRFRDAILGIS